MKKVLTYSQSIENGVVKYLPKVESVTTYKDMQKIVGGPIERIPVPMKINGNVYDIYVNEDGKNEDKLNPSIALLKYDVVVFTCFNSSCVNSRHSPSFRLFGNSKLPILILCNSITLAL